MRRPETDEQLMEGVRRGERGCLDVLVRRHGAPVLSVIRRSVRSEAVAEDLFQDVFTRVWTKRRTFEPGRSFRPWLYAIAMNRCREWARRQPRRERTGFFEGWAADPPAGDGAVGGDEAERAETARSVESAVAALPETQRTVVVLRLVSGMTYGQIASAMGIAEGSARSNMHHALRSLRRSLEPLLRSEPEPAEGEPRRTMAAD